MSKGQILIIVVLILLVVVGYFQMISGRTTTLNHEIMINAKPDSVWQILVNLEMVQHYNPQVASAQYLSNEHQGVNSSRQCTMKDGSVVKERVIAVEENKSITMELYESNWPVEKMKWHTMIEARGEGTLVTQKLDYNTKYGAFGALLNSLMMKNKMQASIQEVFESLKKYSEK